MIKAVRFYLSGFIAIMVACVFVQISMAQSSSNDVRAIKGGWKSVKWGDSRKEIKGHYKIETQRLSTVSVGAYELYGTVGKLSFGFTEKEQLAEVQWYTAGDGCTQSTYDEHADLFQALKKEYGKHYDDSKWSMPEYSNDWPAGWKMGGVIFVSRWEADEHDVVLRAECSSGISIISITYSHPYLAAVLGIERERHNKKLKEQQ